MKHVEEYETVYDGRDDHDKMRFFLAAMTLLFLPIGILLGRKEERPYFAKIVYKIPTCASCKSEPINVIGSSGEHGTIKIIANREFERCWKSIPE